MDKQKILSQLYNEEMIFNEKNLYETSKRIDASITHKEIKKFLKNQKAQQVFHNKPEEKEYKPITSDNFYSFQIDLTFLQKYSSSNDGNYVLFTAINIISRYAYAFYAKNKKASTILKLFKEFHGMTEIVDITCDEGSEFKNKNFIKYCKNEQINIFFVKGDGHKLGIINRFHRTLKENLSKYFVTKKTVKWINVIDKIIDVYNNTVNEGIKCTPEEAHEDPITMNSIMYEKKTKKKNIRRKHLRLVNTVE